MGFEFVKRTRMEATAERLFRWHTRPGAFERLTPPWEPVQVLDRTGGVHDGGRATILTRVGPVPRRWVAEHHSYVDGREFQDRQVSGPFKSWNHRHLVEPDGPQAAFLEDRIEYALPLGLGGSYVRKRLERVFEYRHRLTALDLAAHAACPPLTYWVSGATGFVGSALVPFLTAGGHDAVRLPRDGALPGVPSGPYAVVHLAGESIASGRWNDAKKKRIRDSRVDGTTKLATALAGLPRRPEVLVCASAIGVYGSRGDEVLDETSAAGSDFLAGVCRDWERATEPAVQAGIRVVNLRFGMVLSPDGGALGRMITPFRLGLGGRIGSGRQFISWISRDDAVGAIHHAASTPALHGPVNAVSPEPRSNRDFTRALGRAVGRPTIFPMPGFAARLAFGEMADALLLSSQRVLPRALEGSGYRFRHPLLGDTLLELMGKRKG